jgi:hypothetical protein
MALNLQVFFTTSKLLDDYHTTQLVMAGRPLNESESEAVRGILEKLIVVLLVSKLLVLHGNRGYITELRSSMTKKTILLAYLEI